MAWTIIQQQEKEELVDCKIVRFYPPTVDRTGKQRPGGKLPKPCLRVMIGPADCEHPVILRYTKGTFSVEWFGTMRQPPMRDVTGKVIKRVRQGVDTVMVDTLAEPEFVPGRKTTHPGLESFKARLREFLKPEMIEEIIDAFYKAMVKLAA